MHGISSISGTRTITWDTGVKTYTLSPARLRDFGEKEAYILSLRNQRCPDLQLKSATAAHVSVEEEQAFDGSSRGIIFRLWQALKRSYAEFNTGDIQEGLELAADVIDETVDNHGQMAIQALVMALSGIEQNDLVKNSNGQDATSRAEILAESTMPKTASPGHASTAASPNATAGRSKKSAK